MPSPFWSAGQRGGMDIAIMVATMKAAHKSVFSRSVDDLHHRLDISFREENPGARIRIEAALNEVGVFFRLCAVLYRFSCNVISARISTPDASRIADEFVVMPGAGRAALTEADIRTMINDLESLLFGGLSVLDYLKQNQAKAPALKPGMPRGAIEIRADETQTCIEITGRDKAGLLLCLAQAFYLMDIDIVEADIHTDPDGRVRNRFFVDVRDQRFQNPEFKARLAEELGLLL